jgi:hypothetical protein
MPPENKSPPVKKLQHIIMLLSDRFVSLLIEADTPRATTEPTANGKVGQR